MTWAQRINVAVRRIPPWLLYSAGIFLPFWYLYLGLTNQLGPEPVRALEHAVGLIGLQALVATLAVTPLRKWTGISFLPLRRAIGNLAFFYILCHLLVWLVLDIQFQGAWTDIVKRPYITIGMFGFLAMVPLAMTSNNWMVRKLGPVRWRKLHKLTYVACLAGAIHFVMLAKTWQAEPLTYLAIMIVLLVARLPMPRKKATA